MADETHSLQVMIYGGALDGFFSLIAKTMKTLDDPREKHHNDSLGYISSRIAQFLKEKFERALIENGYFENEVSGKIDEVMDFFRRIENVEK